MLMLFGLMTTRLKGLLTYLLTHNCRTDYRCCKTRDALAMDLSNLCSLA